MPARHHFIDHTADVAVEIDAPDPRSFHAEAARAVVELLTEAAELPEFPQGVRPIAIDAANDAEDLLVQFMNEVLFAAQGEGFLTRDLALDEIDAHHLHGTLLGLPEAWQHLRTEVKCVTYHDLRLTRDAQGLHAVVVIDV